MFILYYIILYYIILYYIILYTYMICIRLMECTLPPVRQNSVYQGKIRLTSIDIN